MESCLTQSVKHALAALRMLFDWLVVIDQVLPANLASDVRGPNYSTKKGKTSVLSARDTRQFFDSVDVSTSAGLRYRALVGHMVYSFVSVGAVVNMRDGDYYQNGKRGWIRLHEKGGIP